ncbi:MAG: nitroreductase [Clostridia bacterium]|nr:nitroreductase [Clostridia bacterium]
MDYLELMNQRHSVRKYTDKPLEADAVNELNAEIDAVNSESGLHIQLVTEEPEAFQAEKPGYGKFSGCKNYFALVGPKGKEEEIGYYGERLVLKAQSLGVNSCWVALTFKKSKAKFEIAEGEKLYMVIAVGYGENQGHKRRSKHINEISDCGDSSPDWYIAGLEAALLAPTAINQQRFYFTLSGNTVKAKAWLGFYTKTDLGIAKYHFEIAAGKENFTWG